MFEINPLRANVIDPATGQIMPAKGVRVSALYPADHLAQRQGDVSIEEIPYTSPAKQSAKPPQAETKPAKPKT